MINYLSGELFKLKKSLAYKICIIIVVALSLLSIGAVVLTVKLANSTTAEGSEEAAVTVTSEYEEPKAVDFLSGCCGGGTLFLITGIFAGIFVATEYTGKTIRQTTSKGISRAGVYWGKMLAVMIATIGFFLAMFVSMFGIGSLVLGVGSIKADVGMYILQYTLTFLMAVFTYSSMAMFVSTLTKSLGWSIGAFVIIDLVASIAITVLVLVFKNKYQIGNYWVESTPALMAAAGIKLKQYMQYAAALLGFGVLSSVGGYMIFKKQEF